MQFAYVKELAESLSAGSSSTDSKETVRDVVLAVPAYFTQFERDAIVDALEIAGLRLVALVNDGTAVALNYAMTRSFPEREYHVVYDAGASGVRATVVAFSSSTPDDKSTKSKAKDATTGKESTQITVAGVGFDRSAGGLELDRRLRDMLAADFAAKHKRDIHSDKRGMTKLWKEAGRIKAILSANSEVMSTVESLAFDIDYRAKFTRTEFEARCSDLLGKFKAPIVDALQIAVPLGPITQNGVIIVGWTATVDDPLSFILALVCADSTVLQTPVNRTVSTDAADISFVSPYLGYVTIYNPRFNIFSHFGSTRTHYVQALADG